MGVTLEWLGKVDCGILRQGKDHHSYRTRDPYKFHCLVIREGDLAIFKGANSIEYCSLVSERDELRRILEDMGVKYIEFEHKGRRFNHDLDA